MMPRITLLLLSLVLICSAGFAEPEPLPIHGTPKWYVVAGSADTSGSAVLVKAIDTGEPLAYFEPGVEFLAFGSNASWTTLAINRRVGYVPSTAVLEKYPPILNTTEWRSGGKTLEQLAEELKQKQKAAKTKPLAPNFGKTPTPAAGVGVAPGMAVSADDPNFTGGK